MSQQTIKQISWLIFINQKATEEIKTIINDGKFELKEGELTINKLKDQFSNEVLLYFKNEKIKSKKINTLHKKLNELLQLYKSNLISLLKNEEESEVVIAKIMELEKDSKKKQISIIDTEFYETLNNEIDTILYKSCMHYRTLKKGCIKPIMVGDLIKVEHELCGYEMGEIAQIENIMAKERKEFSVRNLTRITDVIETTHAKEREESESSTVEDRFQYNTEAYKAQQKTIDTNGSVSAQYGSEKGPYMVKISGSASYSNAKQTAYKASTEYAKNITKEATKSVRESIKEVKKITILNEQERSSIHGFNNQDENAEHITGIYRWVDKVHKNQLFDYGKRLFLEFMIPEPAFFLKDIRKVINHDEINNLLKPTHPKGLTLEIDGLAGINRYGSITEFNYKQYAFYYDVTDIEDHPKPLYLKSIPILEPSEGGQSQGDVLLTKIVQKGTIDINDGYKLKRVAMNGNFMQRENLAFKMLGLIAKLKFKYIRDVPESGLEAFTETVDNFFEWKNIHPASNYVGTIPYSFMFEMDALVQFHMIYEMERTEEYYNKWQRETYAKILQGYERKLQTYNQALALLEMNKKDQVAALELKPRESQYRRIETTELKKHSIDILSAHSAFRMPGVLPNLRHLGDYHKINLGQVMGMPNWQINNINSSVVSFFEECFEWEQIFYQFYPYYWADAKRWKTLYSEVGSGDEKFDEFLKAGYAKVIVPLRPNYEKAVLFFLKTKLIWNGGDLPALNDHRYLSYLEELQDSEQLSKGNGIAVGSSWEEKIPTSFVILQQEPTLPNNICSDDSSENNQIPSSNEALETVEAIEEELVNTIEEEPYDDELMEEFSDN